MPSVPTAEDRAEIAQEVRRAVRCLMPPPDHAGLARIINGSRYPMKLHLAGALHALARLADQADDPERFLDVVAEIVARD
jgi:hypothetical protein